MNFAPHKRRRAPTVIIVSLIDVLLVVLIFLMITTTFKKLEPALQIALPESTEASIGAAEPTSMVVVIATNDPYFYLDGQPITLNELERAVEVAAGQDPKLHIDIKADKRSPVGEFVRVMDVARRANKMGSISVVTEKADR